MCGAGIAGIAAAWQLAVHAGLSRVVIVDPRAPLSLTSDKSTECYRNWWPGPGDAMVALMNRSIDRMEALARGSGNRFLLERRGYLYASALPERIAEFESAAREAADLGAGALRVHDTANSDYARSPAGGFEAQPDGADLLTDPALIRRHFPWLSEATLAVLHARRCGALSAQQLGMLLLEQAREAGVRLVEGELVEVEMHGGAVCGAVVDTKGARERIATPVFVDAAGPFLADVAKLLHVDLPLHCEGHVKISFEDRLGAVPRDAPLFIWTDPIDLPWSDEERAALAEDEAASHLLGRFPSGAHGRPVGRGNSVLLYWTYERGHDERVFPVPHDPHMPEIVLRGMSRMIPALREYFGRLPKPFVDGGYYTKTAENRPLVGPLPVEGAFVSGAYSGFGIMASLGAAELLAAHVTGAALPHYADAFRLERYEEPAYRELLERWPDSGQL